MHVLHHALGIVGRGEPEVIAHLVVPGRRQVGDRQAVFGQGDLEVEAQHDVQVVGRLVGLDPDQRRFDLVDGAVEGGQIDVGQLFGIEALQAGVEALPERQAAADEVLPESRLRFVNGERRATQERRAVQLGGRALLV